jgi:hypothetical protein
MKSTISLFIHSFIHSFIFFVHYGIMLLQDMGVIGKNCFMRHGMGNTERKIRKSNVGEERMIRKDGRKG